MTWADLDAQLSTVAGTVSVYAGRLTGPPAYTREADATHYAASTMKVAVLTALYRAAEAGTLDLDAPVPVVNDFASARPDAPGSAARGTTTTTARSGTDSAAGRRCAGSPTA
ncbi:hypothetical protein GCM10027605_48960 [Micromonospora zhanjiangensis]